MKNFNAKIQAQFANMCKTGKLFRVNLIRKEYKDSIFSNKYLLLSVLSSFLLLLLVIYTPLNKIFETVYLGIYDWFLIFFVSLIVTILCGLFYLISVKITKESD